MGQKVNPSGFRVGISKEHDSFWYAKSNKYSSFVKQDLFIRTFILGKLLDSGVARVLIKRKSSLVNLVVYLSKPNVIFKDNKFDTLTKELACLLLNKYGSHLNSWNIIEVVNPDACASLLAEFVKQQLEKRVAFRKVMKAAILKAQQAGVKGIKIQITGRLNGTEIARTEWIREGRVPLHTLRANIDYCSSDAQTIFGILGIKIWLFLS